MAGWRDRARVSVEHRRGPAKGRGNGRDARSPVGGGRFASQAGAFARPVRRDGAGRHRPARGGDPVLPPRDRWRARERHPHARRKPPCAGPSTPSGRGHRHPGQSPGHVVLQPRRGASGTRPRGAVPGPTGETACGPKGAGAARRRHPCAVLPPGFSRMGRGVRGRCAGGGPRRDGSGRDGVQRRPGGRVRAVRRARGGGETVPGRQRSGSGRPVGRRVPARSRLKRRYIARDVALVLCPIRFSWARPGARDRVGLHAEFFTFGMSGRKPVGLGVHHGRLGAGLAEDGGKVRIEVVPTVRIELTTC